MRTLKFKKRRMGAFAIAAIAAGAMMFSPVAASTVSAAEHEVIGGNYFLSDYDSISEMRDAGNALGTEITEEGTVLLKNEDDALPLQSGKKLAFFGKNLYLHMSALASSLKSEGFQSSTEIETFYNDSSLSGSGGAGYPGNGVVVNGLPTGEADISKFTGNVDGDVAIVGFYRMSGEGFDIPRTMAQANGNHKEFGPEVTPVNGARAVDDHQLQLDKNEAATLKYAAEHFDTVIVIINSPAPMELGFLDDEDHYAYHENIKAALWGSFTTGNAWKGLVNILTGKVNPSGHLPDTYARDFKADPTWNNFGNNFMEDYTEGSLVYAKGNQYANDNMHGGGGNGGGGYFSNYVYYKEGIYSGYRYWETRGYVEGDEAWTGTTTDTLKHYAHGPDEAIHYYSKLSSDKSKQEALDSKEWDNWYKAHVVYPFGYGLSYTDFEWELVDSEGGALAPDGKITVSVKVTNTGAVAGKDVVQLYYSAPYTDKGIEKAHVNLGAYAKTKLLEPEESQTLTLTMNVYDMASYDYNDKNKNEFKGYELEAGDYTIYVGEDAHCWANEDVLKLTYNLSTGVKYETDPVTGTIVKNRFDKISEQLLHEDRYPEEEEKNDKDLYMTRSNFAETWPTLSYRLTAEQWIIDEVAKYNNDSDCKLEKVDPADKPDDPWYNDVMPTQASSRDPNGNYIQLNELFQKEYDDSLWDEFLDQLTVAELRQISLQGSYKSGINIPELGVTEVFNEDLPTCVLVPGDVSPLRLPNDIITAATWNEELAYRRGKALAESSLWGGGNAAARVPGWYAPAVNIHRSPFGGRVGEYLSEDGLLAGRQSAQIVIGAQEKGMFCYVKHFAINSQETNRCGLMTWADEQTMREVYFKPFEICVKEGKTLGIMSSLNRFGPRWAGGCYELLTNVLREEWGFKGNVVTDSYGPWSNADIMIRAGGSLALGGGSIRIAVDSATTINCLRNATHQILYAHANSMALNTGDTPTVPKKLRAFNKKALKTGMVNLAYSDSIAACVELNTKYYPDLDYDDVEFALAESNEMPGGLTLHPDGEITGTPKKAGRMTFTVVVICGTEKLEQTFNMTIAAEGGTVVYESEHNVFKTNINTPFLMDISDAYIYDPYATPEEMALFPEITYTLGNGSRLPSGLTLNSEGLLIGTPDKECRNYTFTVVASARGYGEAECEFVISVLYPISYHANSELPAASYGQSYIATVGTAQCEIDVTYALKEGSSLPKGLTFTEKGYIVGTPAEAGVTTFTVIAKAAYSDAVEATYTIKVNPKFATTTELQSGKTGEAYFGSVATAEGSFDVTYKLVGGALPSGLKLESDGTISGKPTSSGTFTIIVRAEDGELSDEITLTLFISGDSAATTVIKGETESVKGAVTALGVITGVLGAGLVALTVLYVLSLKKSAKKGKEDEPKTPEDKDGVGA